MICLLLHFRSSESYSKPLLVRDSAAYPLLINFTSANYIEIGQDSILHEVSELCYNTVKAYGILQFTIITHQQLLQE